MDIIAQIQNKDIQNTLEEMKDLLEEHQTELQNRCYKNVLDLIADQIVFLKLSNIKGRNKKGIEVLENLYNLIEITLMG